MLECKRMLLLSLSILMMFVEKRIEFEMNKWQITHIYSQESHRASRVYTSLKDLPRKKQEKQNKNKTKTTQILSPHSNKHKTEIKYKQTINHKENKQNIQENKYQRTENRKQKIIT